MELRLPELGEGITDATVVNVPVKPGQPVKAGDTLVEVETDKASMPIPAEADGTVSEVRVKPGDKVKVGAVIAVVGDGKPGAPAPAAPAAKPQTPPAPAPQPAAAPANRNNVAPGRRDFTLPNLGEGIENGIIVAVNVKPGDTVTAGQELFTIETDKASMPLSADADGRVEEVQVKQGDKVNVGAVLAVFSGAPAAKAQPAAAPTVPVAQPKPQPAPVAAAAPSGNGSPGVVTDKGVVPAGPATRRYAREHGVNLAEVPGTARGGRITVEDVRSHNEDGHSQVVALTVPTCRAYDPAFGYEVATIVEEGINRMYVKGEDVFYYLTIYNESYDMPAMPQGVRDGILRGLYPFKTVKPDGAKHTVQLLGSGVILREVLRAQEILATKYQVASTVYSATSYQQLRRDAIECERLNRLHPDQPRKVPYVQQVLGTDANVPVVASSDYMRTLPEQVAPYLNCRLLALGTDGFGRSETRPHLRRFFEVDAEHVTVAALHALAERGQLDRGVVKQAIQDLGIDPDQPAPWTV